MILALALLACRPAAAPRHPAFARGIAALERITEQTLDQDFGDPAFEEAARHFEAVPESSPEHATAVELVERIRAGRARYEARAERERRAKAAAVAKREREAANSVERVAELAMEAREAFEIREADAREDAEREERARRARLEQARVEGDRLVEAREQRAAARARVEEERRARAALVAEQRARCEAARNACRERCAWVMSPDGVTGGLGSPISMQCLEQCPTCE